MWRKLFLTTLLVVFAQEGPTFEVASIKERQFVPGIVGVDFQPGGRVVANQAPLPMLIWAAYDILPQQVQYPPSVPETTLRTFYDIEAKPEANAIPPGRLSRESIHKMELMLQSLLADRFKLKMHTEKKELAVYALVVDKNGLKLPKAPNRDCDVTPNSCRFSKVGPRDGVIGQSTTLESLANNLNGFADRPIVNRTGIEDRFDFNLPPFSRGAATPGTLADGVPVDLNTPSLSSILQEIGLRLEPRKEAFDIYIVDHVEKPSVN
jgi:uncharacterized protein (TIGR03435 family)